MSADYVDIYILFIPFIVLIYGQLTLMLYVIYEIMKVSNRANNKVHPTSVKSNVDSLQQNVSLQTSNKLPPVNENKAKRFSWAYFKRFNTFLGSTNETWKPISKAFRYVVIIALTWATSVCYRFYVLDKTEDITNSFAAWTACAFTYFDGTNDWKDTCGYHPQYRPIHFFEFVVNSISFSFIPIIPPIIYIFNGSYFASAYEYTKLSVFLNAKGNHSTIVARNKSQAEGGRASAVKSVVVAAKLEEGANENQA